MPTPPGQISGAAPCQLADIDPQQLRDETRTGDGKYFGDR